jgi:hypothetical protein
VVSGASRKTRVSASARTATSNRNKRGPVDGAPFRKSARFDARTLRSTDPAHHTRPIGKFSGLARLRFCGFACVRWLPVGRCRMGVAGWALPDGHCRMGVAGWALPDGRCRMGVAGWALCQMGVAGWAMPDGRCRMGVAQRAMPDGRCRMRVQRAHGHVRCWRTRAGDAARTARHVRAH